MSPEITFAKMKTSPHRSLVLFFTLFSCLPNKTSKQVVLWVVVALNGDAHLVDFGNKTEKTCCRAGYSYPQSVATKQGASLLCFV